MAGAFGGIIGGFLAPKISERFGSGASLLITLIVAPLGTVVVGLTSSWEIVWIVTVFQTVSAILWNTITVSLRQSIIPSHLLGRVNSVYRFFAWGSIPIGMAIGGGVVALGQQFLSRETALRTPYFLGSILGIAILVLAAPRLTSSAIEKARLEADN
jgi:MFS family permease